MILLALLAITGLWLGNNAYHLWRNYQTAKSLDVPIILSPVGEFSTPWLILQRLVLPFLERLPSALNSWAQYVKRDGSYIHKYSVHERYSEIFAIVSCTNLTLYVADPLTADSIIARKAGFEKPLSVGRMDTYGPSLGTTVGETWAHQRKITAPPFSESNCRIVWSETLRQTGQMLEYWDREQCEGIRTLADDAMTLSLHVITCAGFGLSYDFESDKKGVIRDEKGRPSYRDCFGYLLANPATLLAIPVWLKKRNWMPEKLKLFLTFRDSLRSHMEEMIVIGKTQAERIISRKGEMKANILSTLVLKSEQARLGLFNDVLNENGKLVEGNEDIQKREGLLTPPTKRGLSDKEVMGNMFLFGLAGHETTARSISYATTMICAYPEIQDWIREELDTVLGKDVRPFETLDYDATFHKLLRCKALMYETVRLFPAISGLMRTTLSTPKTLPLSSGGQIVVPPDTEIYPSVNALHNHPCWGHDVSEFRPSRFISPSGSGSTSPGVSPLNETFSSPPPGVPKGAFNAWGDGSRVCPGRKFAQVEFVGLVVGLLWGHQVEVVLEKGETTELARLRAENVAKDSTFTITLGMREPQKVAFRRTVIR